MALGFVLKERNDEDSVHVELSGEVDILTCQELKERLYEIINAHKKDLVLDCCQLNYIDSTGLGVFVAVLKKVKQIEKEVRIENLKESTKKLFVITRLDTLFNIK